MRSVESGWVVEQRICCCRSRYWPEVCDGKDESKGTSTCVFFKWVGGRKGILRDGFRNLHPLGREVWRGKVYCIVQYRAVHRVDWSRVLKGTTRGNLEGQVLFACRFIVREYGGTLRLFSWHGNGWFREEAASEWNLNVLGLVAHRVKFQKCIMGFPDASKLKTRIRDGATQSHLLLVCVQSSYPSSAWEAGRVL